MVLLWLGLLMVRGASAARPVAAGRPRSCSARPSSTPRHAVRQRHAGRQRPARDTEHRRADARWEAETPTAAHAGSGAALADTRGDSREAGADTRADTRGETRPETRPRPARDPRRDLAGRADKGRPIMGRDHHETLASTGGAGHRHHARRAREPGGQPHGGHRGHDGTNSTDSDEQARTRRTGEAQAPTGPDSEVPGSRAGARPGCRLGGSPGTARVMTADTSTTALRSSRTAQPRRAAWLDLASWSACPQAAAGGAPCWSAEAAARARGPQPPWRDDWRARCSRARGHRQADQDHACRADGSDGARAPLGRSRPAHPVRRPPPRAPARLASWDGLGQGILPVATTSADGWPRPQPPQRPRCGGSDPHPHPRRIGGDHQLRAVGGQRLSCPPRGAVRLSPRKQPGRARAASTQRIWSSPAASAESERASTSTTAGMATANSAVAMPRSRATTRSRAQW